LTELSDFYFTGSAAIQKKSMSQDLILFNFQVLLQGTHLTTVINKWGRKICSDHLSTLAIKYVLRSLNVNCNKGREM